jgi:hypothetical protein
VLKDGLLKCPPDNPVKWGTNNDIKAERKLRYLDFGSMKDSIKLRWLSLSSQDDGITTGCSALFTSFALHADVFGWRAETVDLRLSVFAHMA